LDELVGRKDQRLNEARPRDEHADSTPGGVDDRSDAALASGGKVVGDCLRQLVQ
jgi:hypothetical protein